MSADTPEVVDPTADPVSPVVTSPSPVEPVPPPVEPETSSSGMDGGEGIVPRVPVPEDTATFAAQIAASTAANLAAAQAEQSAPQEPGEYVNRVIHILQDGFTAFGIVWYKGQEIEINKEAYEQTKDREGRSWLEDTVLDQMRRFKMQYWADGEWPFDDYQDQEAAEAERRRNRQPQL